MRPSVPIDPRSSMRALLAYTIRLFREQRGLSQDQLAKELYATRASIQAYESQRNRPDEDFCKRLDDYFGTGELFQGIWYHARREHLHEWFEAYIAHENEATQIRTFQPLSIPGLLQTEGYLRANVFPGPHAEDRIAKRLARRDILTREEKPPFFWAVLDEAAIRRPVGGAKAMKEQLQHLLDVSELLNVSIQVVRECAGGYLGLDGALMILTKPEGRSVGYVEAQFGGRLIEDPSETERLGIRFDQIRGKALSEDASAALIRKTMETIQDDPVAEE